MSESSAKGLTRKVTFAFNNMIILGTHSIAKIYKLDHLFSKITLPLNPSKILDPVIPSYSTVKQNFPINQDWNKVQKTLTRILPSKVAKNLTTQ